ncbi:hypothetical protein AN958_06936 [Leucoagaricus sp. SymC.cos]|nr:hypothetical protein AN958_06936 [Leucoagaricus sp. SymC.cos]
MRQRRVRMTMKMRTRMRMRMRMRMREASHNVMPLSLVSCWSATRRWIYCDY